MPVIPLRNQRKVYLGGVEQTGMFLNGQKVWAKPVPAPQWTRIILVETPVANRRGIVTTVAEGQRVTTASGATDGRAQVNLPPAGTLVTLETNIAFNSATSLTARMLQSETFFNGTDLFTVSRPSSGAILVRTDPFTVPSGMTVLQFFGRTNAGQFFTVNTATRWRFG